MITQGSVAEREYIETLHELHRKLMLIQSHASRDVACTEDVLNVALSLKNAVI